MSTTTTHPSTAIDAIQRHLAGIQLELDRLARENEALRAAAAARSQVADGPLLLKIPHVAELIGTSRQTVDRMIQDGVLARIKFGGLVRVPREEIDRWIAEQMVAAKEAAATAQMIAEQRRRGRRRAWATET